MKRSCQYYDRPSITKHKNWTGSTRSNHYFHNYNKLFFSKSNFITLTARPSSFHQIITLSCLTYTIEMLLTINARFCYCSCHGCTQHISGENLKIIIKLLLIHPRMENVAFVTRIKNDFMVGLEYRETRTGGGIRNHRAWEQPSNTTNLSIIQSAPGGISVGIC